jgi:small subunit ribosomal protein S6
MTLPAPTYDLVLLLDPQAEEDVRAKILADTRAAIATTGELTREDDWGERALAYPIERRATAQYHLLQFTPSTPALLGELDRTLRITDGIVRFRIVKLKPGTPDAPEMRVGAATSTRPVEAPAPAEAPPAVEVPAEASSQVAEPA